MSNVEIFMTIAINALIVSNVLLWLSLKGLSILFKQLCEKIANSLEEVMNE